MAELAVKIDEQKLERAAYVLKAVAHPVRISVIDLLNQREEICVQEICEALNLEQSLISHHLTLMRDKGILSVRREGRKIYYFLTDETITNIIDCINACTRF